MENKEFPFCNYFTMILGFLSPFLHFLSPFLFLVFFVFFITFFCICLLLFCIFYDNFRLLHFLNTKDVVQHFKKSSFQSAVWMCVRCTRLLIRQRGAWYFWPLFLSHKNMCCSMSLCGLYWYLKPAKAEKINVINDHMKVIRHWFS